MSAVAGAPPTGRGDPAPAGEARTPAGGLSLRPGSLVAAGRLGRGLVRGLLVPVCLLVGPVLVVMAITGHLSGLLYDFKGGLYDGGLAILHGHSPYRPAFLARQAAIMRAGQIAIGETTAHPFSLPVYPAPANVALLVLSLLPLGLAGAIWTAASIAAMLGGLRLLGVTDRRCLALVAVSWPFLSGLYLGEVGPFVVLGAAVAWRWRERVWPAALAVASVVALKIFPWTLGAWLLATRRYRALALAVVACLAITLGAWAAIGFHGLAQYPGMLSNMSFIQEGRGDSVVTVLLVAAVPATAATAIALLAAGGLLVAAWRLGRVPGGERRAFGVAIIAALTGTPIVWDHYMVLLFVPIALLSPRLSRLWLLPAITSTLVLVGDGLVPGSVHAPAGSPDALVGAVPWLVAQAVLLFGLARGAGNQAPAGHPTPAGAPAGHCTRAIVPALEDPLSS